MKNRPGWIRERNRQIWTREVSAIEIDGGGELRVRRHASKRFSWEAVLDLLPDDGRAEVTEVSGYAGSLDVAQEEAERGMLLLGRRLPS